MAVFHAWGIVNVSSKQQTFQVNNRKEESASGKTIKVVVGCRNNHAGVRGKGGDGGVKGFMVFYGIG